MCGGNCGLWMYGICDYWHLYRGWGWQRRRLNLNKTITTCIFINYRYQDKRRQFDKKTLLTPYINIIHGKWCVLWIVCHVRCTMYKDN